VSLLLLKNQQKCQHHKKLNTNDYRLINTQSNLTVLRRSVYTAHLSISLSEKRNLKGRRRGAPPSTCLEVPEPCSGFKINSGAPLRRAPDQFKH